jgi:hypothetical protein
MNICENVGQKKPMQNFNLEYHSRKTVMKPCGYDRETGKQLLVLLKNKAGKCFVVLIYIRVEVAYNEDLLFWQC